MEWIQAHLVELLAIIGALYTIGRTIVVLTPTPKDNEALEKVSAILKAIGAALGLDLTQGRNTETATKPPNATICLALALTLWTTCFVSGCITSDKRANVVAAHKVFAGVVDGLTVSIRAGKFDVDEVLTIQRLVHQGQQALADWSDAVEAGADQSVYMQIFQRVLDELLVYEAQSRED